MTDVSPATRDAATEAEEANAPQVESIRRSAWTRLRVPVITVINLAAFFTIWEVFASTSLVNPLFFPKASAMFSALFTGFADGSLLPQLGHSLGNLLIGLVISAAIGIPVGLFMGANKAADLILSPYVWSLTALPRVAFIPLLILILGFGNEMQLTIIVLSATFPIIVNCMAGVKTVDPSLLRAGQVFGTSRLQAYTKIIFPYTLPFIVSGLNQGIARGLVGMLIGELLGGSGEGLGYVLDRAADRFDSATLFAVLLLLAVMSVGLVQFTRWAERRVAPWRERNAS